MFEQQRIRELIAGYFGLESGDTESILDQFERITLHGGDWLFEQGDPGDSLYFLVRGRLRVWMTGGGSAGAESTRKLLGEVGAGETVGEIGLLTGANRTAGIQATRDCLLLKIDRAGFDRLVAEYPGLAMKLAGNIAARLHQRTSRKADSARNLVNICLIPLESTARTQRLMDGLADGLSAFGRTLSLSHDTLGQQGAPARGWDGQSPVPRDLASWLEDRESDNRFLLYRCAPESMPWSSFSVRQADLVVLIGDSESGPEIREWESRLFAGQGEHTAKRALLMAHPGGYREIENTSAWLKGRDTDFHFHVCDERPDSLERVCRILAGKAVGLVLGAGAARGLAHVGVFRALTEAGIPVDWVGGASMGAIMGGAIAHGWSPDGVYSNSRDGFFLNNPFRDYTLPVISLLSGKKMVRLTKRILYKNIEDLAIPYFCISANLDSGSLNLHVDGPMYKAIQAAAALPVAMPPVVVNRHLAIDGAVVNSLPVDIMRRYPVNKVIAVDVSVRKAFEVDYEEVPSSLALLRSRWFPFGRRYRLPGLVALLLKATEVGTLEKMQRLGNDADLLINPPVREFGMTDVKRFDEIVEAGYRAAQLRLKAWDYLSPD